MNTQNGVVHKRIISKKTEKTIRKIVKPFIVVVIT
jgi:hypothetical protein